MHYIEVKETMRGYSEGMFLSPSPFNPYIRRHHKFTRKKILYSFFIEAILNGLPSLFGLYVPLRCCPGSYTNLVAAVLTYLVLRGWSLLNWVYLVLTMGAMGYEYVGRAEKKKRKRFKSFIGCSPPYT